MEMPLGGGAKCPCCGKTVYMAEEVVAAGQKYHKMCFKCTKCNKMLDRSVRERAIQLQIWELIFICLLLQLHHG